MATKNRRKNAFARYFTPFGISQVFDLIMLAASIVLTVGIFLNAFNVTAALLPIGFGIFILGALIGIYRSVKVLTSGISRRAPAFKRAIVGITILSVLLILAVFGMLYFFLWM